MSNAIQNVKHVGLDEGLHLASVKVAQSAKVDFNGATSVNLFSIPADAIVLRTHVDVITAFDASGTSAKATLQVTAPVSTGTLAVFATTNSVQAAGLVTSAVAAKTVAGSVIANLEPGTTTAGQAQVYVEYITQVDKL